MKKIFFILLVCTGASAISHAQVASARPESNSRVKPVATKDLKKTPAPQPVQTDEAVAGYRKTGMTDQQAQDLNSVVVKYDKMKENIKTNPQMSATAKRQETAKIDAQKKEAMQKAMGEQGTIKKTEINKQKQVVDNSKAPVKAD